jgi:hypothetical protein
MATTFPESPLRWSIAIPPAAAHRYAISAAAALALTGVAVAFTVTDLGRVPVALLHFLSHHFGRPAGMLFRVWEGTGYRGWPGLVGAAAVLCVALIVRGVGGVRRSRQGRSRQADPDVGGSKSSRAAR